LFDGKRFLASFFLKTPPFRVYGLFSCRHGTSPTPAPENPAAAKETAKEAKPAAYCLAEVFLAETLL